MSDKIVDIDEYIPSNTIFHFKDCFYRFIKAQDSVTGEDILVNLDTGISYNKENVVNDYDYYTKEDDDNFFGVMIKGKIQWY